MQYVPQIISFLSLIVAFFSLMRLVNGDKKSDIREISGIKESLLKANMKLDQVCATTNETRSDIKSMTKDLQALDVRVNVLERDLKTAFNRIDELKGEISQ